MCSLYSFSLPFQGKHCIQILFYQRACKLRLASQPSATQSCCMGLHRPHHTSQQSNLQTASQQIYLQDQSKSLDELADTIHSRQYFAMLTSQQLFCVSTQLKVSTQPNFSQHYPAKTTISQCIPKRQPVGLTNAYSMEWGGESAVPPFPHLTTLYMIPF